MKSQECTENQVKPSPHAVWFVVLALLVAAGCSAPPQTTRVEVPPPAREASKPAITVKVATLDISNFGRRIEKNNLERFSVQLKREQIDVLALQGISRYPNVKTRTDVVGELAALTDMRQVFGESTDISGRQQGNAVFSIYPIRTNINKPYDVPSAFSESALEVAIDAGVRDLVVVSTRLPQRASEEDIASCIRVIAELRQTPQTPFIVAGNLPRLTRALNPELFTDVLSSLPEGAAKQLTSRVWYATSEQFRLLNTRMVKTELGMLTVAEFGLFDPALRH